MARKIVVVDENDKVAGYKDKEKVISSDIYRVSSLWIINSKREVLLSRRAYNKVHDPGKWGASVDGTVEKGEDYYTNILKEAEEELGLKNINPKKFIKERFSGEYNYFCQSYLLKLDKEIEKFELNKDEVVEVRWFSRDDLIREINKRPDDFVGSKDERIKQFDILRKFSIG